jgi:hypothetical protein
MSELLILEDYDKIKQTEFEQNKAKKDWKFYRKFGITKGSKQHKYMQKRYQAKKQGISVH